MFSSLFGKTSYAFNIDLEVLADPTLLVSNEGRVIDANQSFTKHLGWQKNDLVKESVHMLIPMRVISKRNHDDKMKNYKYGQRSNFIGYDKVLPVKDSHEEEHLCQVRITPVQSNKKTVNFLCFFKPTQDHHVVLNPKGVLEEIGQHFRDLPADYLFRDNLPEKKEVLTLRLCKEYLQGELGALKSLIVDNCTIPTMINYIVSIIHNPRSPHLRHFKALLARTRSEPEIVFLNIIILRLLFPILIFKHPELKEELKTVFQKIYDALNKDTASAKSVDFDNSHLLIGFTTESDLSSQTD